MGRYDSQIKELRREMQSLERLQTEFCDDQQRFTNRALEDMCYFLSAILAFLYSVPIKMADEC